MQAEPQNKINQPSLTEKDLLATNSGQETNSQQSNQAATTAKNITKILPINNEQQQQQTTKQEKLIGNTFYVILRCIIVSFGAVYTGYNFGSYSFVQPTMAHVLDNDSAYINGLCNGLLTLGIAIGSLSTYNLVHKVFKKRTNLIYFGDVLGLLACAIQLYPTQPTLYIGRFLGGVVAGFNFWICPVYIKEYVPYDWIETCISIYSNSVNLGVMLSYLVGFSLDEEPKNNDPTIWRLNLAFPVIFCILRTALMPLLYKKDTPIYYLEQNDDQQAKQALLETHNPKIIDEAFQSVKQQYQQSQQNAVPFMQLLAKKFRKRLLMAIFASSSEALTGLQIYTAYSWMLYSNVVSQKISISLSITQVGVQMFGMLILGHLVRRFGRKQLMITALLVSMLAQCGQTIAQYYLENEKDGAFLTFLTIFCIQLYYLCLGMGISCVTFLIVVDLVPQSGISTANAFMAIFNSIYSFGFPVLIEVIPMWKALMILCICHFVLITIYKFWVVETKGLNEEQLDKIFLNKKKS